MREYNAAIFGRVDDDVAGLPFDVGGLDRFEAALVSSDLGRAGAFATDLALVGGAEVGVRVTVRVDEEGDPLRMLAELGDTFRTAAWDAYGLEVRVTEAEVLLQEIFEEREEKEATFRERISLVGQTDFAEILGVSHQRVGRLEAQRASGERDDFPAPADHTSGGPQWLAEDAERFKREWRRKPGRPRKRGPGGSRPEASSVQ